MLHTGDQQNITPGLPWWLRIRLPMQEVRVQSLGQEDPLEKEMGTQSSILAWRIPWTKEPGGWTSLWGRNTVGQDLATKQEE